jgi:hypothetical protein
MHHPFDGRSHQDTHQQKKHAKGELTEPRDILPDFPHFLPEGLNLRIGMVAQNLDRGNHAVQFVFKTLLDILQAKLDFIPTDRIIHTHVLGKPPVIFQGNSRSFRFQACPKAVVWPSFSDMVTF